MHNNSRHRRNRAGSCSDEEGILNLDQNNLQPDDLRALALHLAAFTELLEQRGNHVVQQTHEAAQHLSQTAQSTERMTGREIGRASCRERV